MKNLKNLNPFFKPKSNDSAVIALAAGGIILGGLAASLFLTNKGNKTRKRIFEVGKKLFSQTKKNAESSRQKLSRVVDDVREHIRDNAETLLGSERDQAYAAEIHPNHTATSAWKKPRKNATYPKSTLPVN